MSAERLDRRLALEALEPRMRDWAVAMTRDAQEAETLIHDTLIIARDPAYAADEEVDLQVWIFRLLRQRFYSLARDREFRRSRSAFATEHAYARKRAVLAQAVADGSAVAIEA